MVDTPKIKQILDLFKNLTEQEKSDFMNELAEDEELMSRLLNILMSRNEGIVQGELTDANTFIDFLRRVKE
jgi:hypothetical protein